MTLRAFGRIVVITRKTRLQEMLERFVTEAQARFYLERMGLSIEEYVSAHRRFLAAKDQLRSILPDSPRPVFIDWSLLPTFDFHERDLVVALGTNGLVANSAKYAGDRPILGVNADPELEDGILVPFRLDGLDRHLDRILRGSYRTHPVTMAKATLNDGQEMLAFNDLFIGHRGHVSARYRIEYAGRTEDQVSSGIIVSTGAGSTGWMASIAAGSVRVARSLGVVNGEGDVSCRFDWDENHLLFAVREPWPSRRTSTGLVFGQVDTAHPLRIVSQMPEDGVIFSDGVMQDAVRFTSGAVVRVGTADRKAQLIGA